MLKNIALLLAVPAVVADTCAEYPTTSKACLIDFPHEDDWGGPHHKGTNEICDPAEGKRVVLDINIFSHATCTLASDVDVFVRQRDSFGYYASKGGGCGYGRRTENLNYCRGIFNAADGRIQLETHVPADVKQSDSVPRHIEFVFQPTSASEGDSLQTILYMPLPDDSAQGSSQPSDLVVKASEKEDELGAYLHVEWDVALPGGDEPDPEPLRKVDPDAAIEWDEESKEQEEGEGFSTHDENDFESSAPAMPTVARMVAAATATAAFMLM